MQVRTHVHMRAYPDTGDPVDEDDATILLARGDSLYGLHISIFDAAYDQRYGYFLTRAAARRWLGVVDTFALAVMEFDE